MLWEAGPGFCRAEGNFAGKREWLGPERGMTAGDGRGRAGMERALPRCCRPVGNIGNCRSAGKRPSALPGNDLLKDALLRAQLMADNVPCHLVAAFSAGFCATVVASAVDVVKRRYMNSGPGQYRNALSCLLALLMQDGPAGLYKGFVPSCLRLGSWDEVMFVSYEQLQRAMALARPALA